MNSINQSITAINQSFIIMIATQELLLVLNQLPVPVINGLIIQWIGHPSLLSSGCLYKN
jgi:hypothetical protein